MSHDPLCPWPALSRHPNHCQCDLIARVRDDERKRMTLPEWAQVVADARASLRAQIADAIESARDHFAQRTGTSSDHPLCRAYDDAARIAREWTP